MFDLSQDTINSTRVDNNIDLDNWTYMKTEFYVKTSFTTTQTEHTQKLLRINISLRRRRDRPAPSPLCEQK